MAKTLIIAEKPSVATDLARSLAKAPGMKPFSKEKDYFENETHIISSAIGHLVELKMPEVNGKKIGWGFTALPIVPQVFELQPVEKTEDRYKLLVRLMKRKDVDTLVNACDAGREGELIFRYIVELAGVQKPIQRMWFQSMTQGAILDSFKKLRSDEEMRPLADAAKCRSESDWIVGINGTRALTAMNSRHGGFRLTPVGRVQTPTLAILAEREKNIASFVPRTYFEVHGLFGIESGRYNGRWIDESFQKDENDEHKKAERIWDKAKAEAIVARCVGKPGVITEQSKATREIAPLLYDLTSLQREASNRFGFSARRTLQLAQALYEKHKVLTYPRTDSRHLPEDYLGNVIGTMKTIASSNMGDTAGFAAKALNASWVRPNKRTFDNSKVSDHFAIIPTGVIPSKLDEAEGKLFDMVLRRFIAVFFPPAEWDITTRYTRVGEDCFKSDGKVLREPGWRAVYGRKGAEESSDDDKSTGKVLTPYNGKEHASTLDVEMHEEATRPPPRFNEATLLGIMEGAGKLVEDEELAEAMSERGLGTPATRAAIIEGLISDEYIMREGRDLVVTAKGLGLIDQLSEIGVEALTSPEMTGQWEYKLRQMEHHKLDRPTFMKEIKAMAASVVDKTKGFVAASKARVFPELDATCSFCGTRGFNQTDEFFGCKGCKLRVRKMIARRQMSEPEVRTLIEKRFLGPLDGFLKTNGEEFSASLEIGDDLKTTFYTPKIDISTLHTIAPCPVCAHKNRKQPGQIYDTPNGYICSVALNDQKACNARLPKVLCQKEISVENAIKFFTEGKTGLIENMISKRNRPFSAYLNCKPEGKRLLEWEFPPREPKPKAAKKGAKRAAADEGEE